ncbi:MAG: MATE family efflux transporter [Bacteroidota bacterium]
MSQTSVPNLQLHTSYKQILSIAIPIAAAIVVPQFNFITNNVFLGHLSEAALAAAGITGVYYLIFAVIGYGLNNGLQSLISRRAGENRPEEIGKLFIQGVYITLAIAAFGILLSYTLGPVVLKLTLHDPVIYTSAVSFLKIRIWGLPFLYIYQMRNALLVGTNNSRYLVSGTIAETVTNVALDYLLIFGMLGFPKLGFNGAAIASVIAEFVGMAVVFAVVHYKGIGKQFGLLKHSRFDPGLSKLILVQSSPLILQYFISVACWEFFYILVEHHGARDLAVSNTMRNIFGLFGCASWAFAATTTTMVSNIIGQGRQDMVLELVKKIARLSLLIGVGLAVLLNIFPHLFLSIYGQGSDFTKYATPVLRVVSVALVCMSFSTVWLNAITGTGNTKVNLAIEVFTITLYCVYVWLVLEKWQLSITIGWTSELLYWLSMFSLSYWYLHSGKWRGKKI